MRIEEQPGSVTFEVKVQPRAARDRLLGVERDRLKIALAAPPVDGAANDALIAFLAAALHVPKRAVEIVRGERGRVKLVRVSGTTRAAVERWVGA